MKISEQFDFESLDDASRHYLLHVRDHAGRDMPGVYVPCANQRPIIAFFVGCGVLLGTALIAFNRMVDEPLGVAMLETAGLLLGGWLILYALRIQFAARGSRYAGHFIFADATTLWECNGSKVIATSIDNLVEARSKKQFGSDGKYVHTTVTVETADGTHRFDVRDEADGREIIAYLNALAWLRTGDDDPTTPGLQKDPRVKYDKLSAPVLGQVARKLLEQGVMPRDLSPQALGLDVSELPRPTKEGRASFGFLNYVLIIGVAVGGVFAFNQLNAGWGGWRDDAIWTNITNIEELDDRAPWLRLYLADSRNVKHRDDARTMLRNIYNGTVNRIRFGLIQKPNVNQNVNQFGNLNLQPFAGPGAEKIEVDQELLDGLTVVLKELAEQPLPLVTVSVKEKAPGKEGANDREQEMMNRYTLALRNGVGKELVQFVKAPDGTAGMIEVEYEFKQLPARNWRFIATFSFRKSTDGVIEKAVTRIETCDSPTSNSIGPLADKFGTKTAGPKKIILEQFEN